MCNSAITARANLANISYSPASALETRDTMALLSPKFAFASPLANY